MESTFSSQGILVGDTEYGLYTALARLVIVAFVSDIAIRFIFAQRIGIYLVTELSVRGGMRAWFKSIFHRSNATHSRLLASALFAIAFFLTRGLDVAVTTYFSARQESSIKRLTYVSTADLSKCPTIAGTFEGVVHNRSAVYFALKGITLGDPLLRQGNLWPEVIGGLTDAEIAAVTLSPEPCVPVQATPLTHLDFPVQFGPKRFQPTLDLSDSGQAYSSFGEDINLFKMSPDTCLASCGVLLPIPFGHLASQHSSGPISIQSQRQFGILSSDGVTLSAYDMECGLAPNQIKQWFLDHKPTSPTRDGNSTLWYTDYHIVTAHSVFPPVRAVFLFLYSNKFKDEYELLSIGGHIPQDRAGFRAKVVTRSTENFSFGRSSTIENPPQSSFIPLEQSPLPMYCRETPRQYIHFQSPHGDGIIAPNPSQLNGPVSPFQKCTIGFLPPKRFNSSGLAKMSANASFIYDPGHRGSEICRMRLLRYPSPERPRNFGFPSDVISVFRYHNGRTGMGSTTSTANFEIRCMGRDKDGAPQLPRPGIASLGNNTIQYGYLADSALLHFNRTTGTDPMSPQVVHISLLSISWVELGVVFAMAILLSVMGVWGDVAEMVALVMYAFSHHPTPPAIIHKKSDSGARDDGYVMCTEQQHATLADGLSGVSLMQPVHFAAVQLELKQAQAQRQDSNPVLDLRLVPVSWNAAEGDSVSLVVPQADGSAEKVVAISGVFEQVMQAVRRYQGQQKSSDASDIV